jgi:hypothetical protein
VVALHGGVWGQVCVGLLGMGGRQQHCVVGHVGGDNLNTRQTLE